MRSQLLKNWANVLDYNKVTSKLASTDGGTSAKSFKFLSGMMTLLIPYRCAASICEDW
jgi:hypothetical protein